MRNFQFRDDLEGLFCGFLAFQRAWVLFLVTRRLGKYLRMIDRDMGRKKADVIAVMTLFWALL